MKHSLAILALFSATLSAPALADDADDTLARYMVYQAGVGVEHAASAPGVDIRIGQVQNVGYNTFTVGFNRIKGNDATAIGTCRTQVHFVALPGADLRTHPEAMTQTIGRFERLSGPVGSCGETASASADTTRPGLSYFAAYVYTVREGQAPVYGRSEIRVSDHLPHDMADIAQAEDTIKQAIVTDAAGNINPATLKVVVISWQAFDRAGNGDTSGTRVTQ